MNTAPGVCVCLDGSNAENNISLLIKLSVKLSEKYRSNDISVDLYTALGVDRLSAPILSILPIIDIGHFKNRFADKFLF